MTNSVTHICERAFASPVLGRQRSVARTQSPAKRNRIRRTAARRAAAPAACPVRGEASSASPPDCAATGAGSA